MSDKPSWWNETLTRREASQRTAMVGVALAGLGAAATAAGCSKNEEVESDARALQEEHGWNVGYDSEDISLSNTVDEDSLGNDDWADRRTPEALLAATRPETQRWRSHESPALFQALAQPTLAEEIEPIFDSKMERAYGVGYALAELVDGSENAEKTLIIVDMPGASAVAAAAGASQFAEPVFWLDNWPHPRGVVPSQEPLAATLYYAAELEQSREARESLETHATVMVLDSNRLTPYSDATSQFDNRYIAELPDAATLVQYGVDKVVYLTPSNVRQNESDDLNDIFVEYNKNDIDIAFMSQDEFGRATLEDKDGNGVGHRYYYGESEDTHRNFYRHHAFFLFIPGRYGWGRPSPTRVRPTPYTPRPRQTLFSSRTTGTAAGVGRTRPTGFGRVTHVAGRGGRVGSVRSGSMTRRTTSASG